MEYLFTALKSIFSPNPSYRFTYSKIQMEAIDDRNAKKKVFCMKIARRTDLCPTAKELIQPFDRREIFTSASSYAAACAAVL